MPATFRLAAPADLDLLLILNREFCALDQHPFDEQTLRPASHHAVVYPSARCVVSADSVVPGNASGGMDGVALKGLTVDFHEPGFVAALGQENGQPFWFQMSNEHRQWVGSPWRPHNPRVLNRYSYVQNNPILVR
jgi:hypothetical protein